MIYVCLLVCLLLSYCCSRPARVDSSEDEWYESSYECQRAIHCVFQPEKNGESVMGGSEYFSSSKEDVLMLPATRPVSTRRIAPPPMEKVLRPGKNAWKPL